jgi:hypothetical protein
MRQLSLLGVSLLPSLILSLVVIFSPHTGVLSFQILSRRQELMSLRNYATRSVATATVTRLITSTISKSSSLSLSSNNDNDEDDDSSSHPYEYDLAVIGAGPVGVQAAIAAATQMFSSSLDSDSKNPSNNRKRKVVLIDAPRASGKLMNEETNEDLSIGGPTGELVEIYIYIDTKVVLRCIALRCVLC